MRRWIGLLALASLMVTAPRARAQEGGDDAVTAQGVRRAAGVVDAVFVDRVSAEGVVGVGDWAAYLMARLGVVPFPDDLRIRAAGDTDRIVLRGRLGDLPSEARRALGPLFGMLPGQTEIAGDITLDRPAREVVHFRLANVRVNGISIPDPLVQSAMSQVGRQYPALTKSGRDLFIQVPRDATVQLVSGGVRLLAPPAAKGSR